MRQNLVSILSIGLLMTQLGIGTCHCLHENVWLQAVCNVLGFADSPVADCVTPPGDPSHSPGHSGHDEDCDCQGESAFIGSMDDDVPLSDRNGWLEAPAVASWCNSPAFAWSTPVFYGSDLLPGVAVRAELGVYLL